MNQRQPEDWQRVRIARKSLDICPRCGPEPNDSPIGNGEPAGWVRNEIYLANYWGPTQAPRSIHRRLRAEDELPLEGDHPGLPGKSEGAD